MRIMSQPSTPPGVDLSQLRVDYRRQVLSEHEVDRDPIRQFSIWLDEAVQAKAIEPNAMTLATCSRDGAPTARMVLLKRADHEGFVFFTNYDSAKGRELRDNPRASLVFWWAELERQVRLEGTVTQTTAAESDEYFAKRPPTSRIGAAASAQSTIIESREALERAAASLNERFPNGSVPRPANWGGFIVHPVRIEFWQGRTSRLHDRVDYLLKGAGEWVIRRLAP